MEKRYEQDSEKNHFSHYTFFLQEKLFYSLLSRRLSRSLINDLVIFTDDCARHLYGKRDMLRRFPATWFSAFNVLPLSPLSAPGQK